MTPHEYRAVLPRLGVNCDMHDLAGLPMLFERSSRVCTETNPAHGGYTTARDLSRFYSRILERLGDAYDDLDAGLDVVDDGERGGGLPSRTTLLEFCSTARPTVFDQVLDRECAYGLGFMTELHQHAFGDHCSIESFGHSGNVGSSFAFADPRRGLAVGVMFNGLVSHEAAFLRRRALVNAMYEDLDAYDDETRAEADVPEAAPRSRFKLRRRARN
jgi:hypothetical protein